MTVTLIILIITVAMFIWGRVRADIVALTALAALLVFGILTPTEALAGFSSHIVAHISVRVPGEAETDAPFLQPAAAGQNFDEPGLAGGIVTHNCDLLSLLHGKIYRRSHRKRSIRNFAVPYLQKRPVTCHSHILDII